MKRTLPSSGAENKKETLTQGLPLIFIKLGGVVLVVEHRLFGIIVEDLLNVGADVGLALQFTEKTNEMRNRHTQNEFTVVWRVHHCAAAEGEGLARLHQKQSLRPA